MATDLPTPLAAGPPLDRETSAHAAAANSSSSLPPQECGCHVDDHTVSLQAGAGVT